MDALNLQACGAAPLSAQRPPRAGKTAEAIFVWCVVFSSSRSPCCVRCTTPCSAAPFCGQPCPPAKMPVPVTASNPDGKGLVTHKNQALPSKGSLFSRLGADSATRAMEDKQKEQATHWKDRRAAANGDGAADTASAPDASANGSAPAIVVDNLEFRYTGDDGAPLPGACRCFVTIACRSTEHRYACAL